MAPEEKPKKDEAPDGGKKAGKTVMIAGIAGGVVVVAAVVLTIVAVKAINKGPAEAAAGASVHAHPDEPVENPDEKTVEVLIANQFECSHTNTGRQYVIRMTIYAAVPQGLVKAAEGGHGKEEGHGHGKKLEAEVSGIQVDIGKNIASIKDRMRTVIASADASTLCLARSEKPDYALSTLRRQFKTILDDVLGKGKVKDVLIADYMPTPMD